MADVLAAAHEHHLVEALAAAAEELAWAARHMRVLAEDRRLSNQRRALAFEHADLLEAQARLASDAAGRGR